ncbi:MAG: molybdenum cofactor guanylyltransferase [Acidobacteria bacterium]|nr:molybdenum cofactor guanylyltransferase [Acidobacteriota bacterium]
MKHKFGSITGFVLAGGESRRMGGPKQSLMLGGETMLERQIRLLRSVCRSVTVVGPRQNRTWREVQFLPDPILGRGPLGGVYAALGETRSEFNLIAACDLPFLETRFLNRLASLALDTRADVTIPEDKSRRLLPLCAVYRRELRGILRGRLAQDSNKADGYFRQLRLCVLPWRETMRSGFSVHIFDNINRPEDYEAAKLRLAAV